MAITSARITRSLKLKTLIISSSNHLIKRIQKLVKMRKWRKAARGMDSEQNNGERPPVTDC